MVDAPVPTIAHRLLAPIETHRRRATCAEVECPQYLEGYMTTVPVGSPQAVYIAERMNQGEPPHRKRAYYKVADADTFRAVAGRVYAGQTDAGTLAAIANVAAQLEAGGMICFVFPPGQRCWEADRHTLPTGRPAIFVRETGLRYPTRVRGQPGPIAWAGDQRRLAPEEWQGDLIDNQARIADLRERHL